MARKVALGSEGKVIRRSWERWPAYPEQARKDIMRLLRDGTRLTAQRANPNVGAEPAQDSWAWRLEQLASRMTGRKAVVCANATLGLTASLHALELPPSAVVATTAFTFSATAAAIVNAGLMPFFCDIDPVSMTIEVKQTLGMHAVVPVDLFGQPHTDTEIHPCVQDASQAVGSKGAGREAPGDFIVWSFNGRKNVPAGEAGLVLTRSHAHAEYVRWWLGHAENFGVPWVGTNGHLNELSACLAYHGLLKVRKRNEIRQRRARLLNRLLADLPIKTFPDSYDHAFYVYPLILKPSVDRERLVTALARLGVLSQPGYIQPPIHEYPAFKACATDKLPVTEELSRKTLLLLPTQITSETTIADVHWIASRMRIAMNAVTA